jgi:hypothetical protein
MAQITVETIEKLNIDSVLKALEQERKAEEALNNVTWALNTSKKDLIKVIKAQEAAERQNLAVMKSEAAEVNRLIDLEQRAAMTTNAVTAGTKNLSGGLSNLSFQLNDVVTGLASGQKPMQVFAQQGGQIFQAFQQTPGLFAALKTGIAGTAEVGSALLLPFLSVGIPLWYDYASAQEQATAAAESWNETQAAAEPLYDQALDDVRALKKLTEGALTLEETKAKIAERYNEQLAAANIPLRERIDLLAKEWQGMAKTDSRYVQTVRELEDLHAEIRNNNRAAAEGAIASATMAEYNYAEAESDRKLAEDKKALAEARKAHTKAIKKEAEELAFLNGVNDKIEALDKSDLFDTPSMWEGLETYDEIEARKTQAANKRAQAVMDLEENLARVAREKREKELGYVADYTGAASDMFGVLYERKAEQAEAGDKAAAKAALRLWKAEQALSISEAFINGLVAVSKASTSAPPPLNLIPMGVAAAQSAVTVGAIASQSAPTFDDTPAPVVTTRQNAAATFKKGDIVVAAQSPQEVQRQAATLGGAGGMSTARRLAQINTGWMLTQQLSLTVRGQAR